MSIFPKFRNVTISQYIRVIISGSCMLHSGDNQSSVLYVVYFMFLTFRDKLKMVQKEMSIFQIFEM